MDEKNCKHDPIAKRTLRMKREPIRNAEGRVIAENQTCRSVCRKCGEGYIFDRTLRYDIAPI